MQLAVRTYILSTLSSGETDPSAVDTVPLVNMTDAFSALVRKVAGAVAQLKSD